MPKTAVVARADAFGRTLTILGGLVAILSMGLAIVLALKAHDAGIGSTGNSINFREASGLAYWAILAIGFGGVIVGAVVAWAGYVLRTLAAIHDKTPTNSARRAETITRATEPEPMQIPSFGESFTTR